jgi:RNA polymerase sigma factor (sigma-70 family)
MVADNHNLIYWIVKIKHLNVEDWYDLLSIELCMAVQKFNPTKGTLANYYNMRCNSLIARELAKEGLQKNANNGIVGLCEIDECTNPEEIEDYIRLKELFGNENAEIFNLKLQGYTQGEIAEKLGVTQSNISKTLRRIKDEYYRQRVE